jgi:hypothetical protein
MVDIAFREDNQWVRMGLQDVDRVPERPHVHTFTIDTEAPVLPKHQALERVRLNKDLPGRHHVKRAPQLVRRLVQGIAIGVSRMVGCDQHPSTFVQGTANVFHALNLDLQESLFLPLLALSQRTPKPDPPRTQLR